MLFLYFFKNIYFLKNKAINLIIEKDKNDRPNNPRDSHIKTQMIGTPSLERLSEKEDQIITVSYIIIAAPIIKEIIIFFILIISFLLHK